MHQDDIEQIRSLIREETAPLRSDVAGVKAELTGMKSGLTEQMRDMQTELLRGIEAFARGNFSRLHIFDTRISSNDVQLGATNDRITALE